MGCDEDRENGWGVRGVEGRFQTSDFSGEEEERCRRRYKAIAGEEQSN